MLLYALMQWLWQNMNIILNPEKCSTYPALTDELCGVFARNLDKIDRVISASICMCLLNFEPYRFVVCLM